MPYFYSEAEVNVDIDDFLTACNSRDIKDLIQALREDGYIVDPTPDNISIGEGLFIESLNKLQQKYLQLTNEEIAIIETIAEKY